MTFYDYILYEAYSSFWEKAAWNRPYSWQTLWIFGSNLERPWCDSEHWRKLHSIKCTVAKFAYYKRLWACFSVKSLINIGSRGLRVFGLVVKVFLFLLYCMSYCFEVLELKQKMIITYKNNNKYNDISGFRVIFVCVQSVIIALSNNRSRFFGAFFIGPLACFSHNI